MMADPLKLGVFGAGAIGGYLGLRLAAGGAEVVLHGRQWLVDVADELCAFDLEGKRLAPSVRVVSDDITVAAAVFDSIDIAADVWLIEGVPQGVFDALEALVRQSGLAALIATHNHTLANRMDRKVTLAKGKVVAAR